MKVPDPLPEPADNLLVYSKALKGIVNPDKEARIATRQLHVTQELFPLQSYGLLLRARRRWVDKIAKAQDKVALYGPDEDIDLILAWQNLQNLDQVLGSYIAAFKYSFLRPYGLGDEKSIAEDRKTTWYTNGIFVVENNGKDPFKEDVNTEVVVCAVIGLSGWDPLPVPKGHDHLGKDRRAHDIYHDPGKGPHVWLRPVATMKIKDELKDTVRDKYSNILGTGNLKLTTGVDSIFTFNALSFAGDKTHPVFRDKLVYGSGTMRGKSKYIEIAWKKSVGI